MQYSAEVEKMCPVAKGAYHGPAPIPEEGKWVQAKEISDISGYTHGVGWCAPQQGACKLSLNVKEGVIEEALIETIGCSGMTHSAAMAAEILPGKTILEAVRLEDKHFIISRIWRGDNLIIPSSQTVLTEGDHLLVLIHPEDLEEMEAFFGKRAESRDWNRPDIDWDAIDSQLISKRLIITNSKVNGAKLGALRLRNQYGINITRIDRAGIEILATPDLYLQLGDRISVVGEAQEVERAAKFLGDSINTLDKPKLFSFFLGLAMGCIIGSIPLTIPGLSMPIKLGLAGGPIIIGILMGAFGARFRIATYMSNSATQLIKQLGIILYLAGLGLASGSHFFEMIIHGDGLLWIGLGFLITVLPTMIVGLISLFGYKKTHAETVGMLCGVMANSMALDYAMSINESRSSSVAYAIVYPVGMFVRIISAQIILSFFL